MMLLMKMVRRNPAPILSTLGGMKRNFMVNIRNRSIATKTEDEQQQILCFSVVNCYEYPQGVHRVRWYGIRPPASVSRKKSSGSGITLIRSISTKAKLGPSLLCETFHKDLPFPCASVALDSVVYMYGGPNLLNIDLSCRQITVRQRPPMFGEENLPPLAEAVVLDGKIYFFSMLEELGVSPAPRCQVFDPNSNQWDALPAVPAPKSEYPVFHPVLYEKEKKIFLFDDGVSACAFDVTTNSWEAVEMPPQVFSFIRGLSNRPGERFVIVGDILYMFDRQNYFHAYDLKKKQLHVVDGLDEETKFMPYGCLPYEEIESPIFLIKLGKKDHLCLVTARGPAPVGGLHVRCLKFHVLERDGRLLAVILGRDSYYIQDALHLFTCDLVNRVGLGTSAISCSFTLDDEKQVVQ